MHLRSCVVNILVLSPTRHIISYYIIISRPSSQRGFDAGLENCVVNILVDIDNVPLSNFRCIVSTGHIDKQTSHHKSEKDNKKLTPRSNHGHHHRDQNYDG